MERVVDKLKHEVAMPKGAEMSETSAETGPEPQPGRGPGGRFAAGNQIARRHADQPDRVPSFRTMVQAAITRQGGLELVERQVREHPLEMMRIASRMEPRDLNVQSEMQHVVMIMLPAPPPPGWKPPIDADITRHLPGRANATE